jgi:multiple sugar transport system permease protein
MHRRKANLTGVWMLLAAGASLIAVFPMYWVLATSLKAPGDVFRMPPKWIFSPTFENYRSVFGSEFPQYFLHSVIVSVGTVAVSLLIGVPAAYSLSRSKMKRKKDIDFFLLSTRMAPPIAFVVPFYILWSKLHLVDTYLGLILIYLLFTIAFVVWMMRASFETVPRELDEAATVDGCTKWGAFFRVALPSARLSLVATVILSLLLTWNEFFYALIMTSFNTETMPVAVPGYIGVARINWGELCAAGTIIVAPVLLFAMLVQKFLMRGLVGGYGHK